MLIKGKEYKPSMTRFLNKFSEDMKSTTPEKIEYFKALLDKFLENSKSWSEKSFISQKGKFNMLMFESVFAALCETAYENNNYEISITTTETLLSLKEDAPFITATSQHTTNSAKVKDRLRIAKEKLTE